MCVMCVAMLIVLIEAGRRRPPVFLPVVAHLHSSDTTINRTVTRTTDSSSEVSPSGQGSEVGDVIRVLGVLCRPGDRVARVAAVDLDEPRRTAVKYHIIRDSWASSAFDIDSFTGVLTLTTNETLLAVALAGVTSFNITLQAAAAADVSGRSARNTSSDSDSTTVLASRTVVRFELVHDTCVNGLHCSTSIDQQGASVASATNSRTLTADFTTTSDLSASAATSSLTRLEIVLLALLTVVTALLLVVLILLIIVYVQHR